MKITRTKAIFALTAAALVGSVGVAAAQEKPVEKPVTLTEKDQAAIDQEWAAIERELANLTAEQKAELEKLYADSE